MAQHLTDDLGMDPLVQEQGCGGMAQIVKPDLRQSRLGEQRAKAPVEDMVGLQWTANGIGEDHIVVFPGSPQVQALSGLLGSVVA
jgi:hypothetical protein